MSSLFNFADTSTGFDTQLSNEAFGVVDSNKFRVTSTIQVESGTTKTIYAMMEGEVLLQPQKDENTNALWDSKKVNLILKPTSLTDLKLPIKYIIYRGFRTTEFLVSDSVTETTKLKQSTNNNNDSVLKKMADIQQQRAGTTDIEASALFSEHSFPTAPPPTTPLKKLFKPASEAKYQLFKITKKNINTPPSKKIELGQIYAGETIGVDIILENAEFEPTIEMAQKAFYNIDVSASSNPPKDREQLRHFVDPVAFYGFHHDINGGIGYQEGTLEYTNHVQTIYDKILQPFHNKNTVYLDIRNEREGSYNFEKDYLDGKIKIDSNTKSYYTQEWPLHMLKPNIPSLTLQLRIGINQRPLIVARDTNVAPISVKDANQEVYYIDEILLLPQPVIDFTNPITISLPSSSPTAKPIATIAKLEYVKQFLPITPANKFPKNNLTDYIFGPVEGGGSLPWNTDHKITWIATNFKTNIDTSFEGYMQGQYKTAILSIDEANKKIEIFDEVFVDTSKKMFIEFVNGDPQQAVSPQSFSNGSGKTVIEVSDTLKTLQAGDQLTLSIRIDGKFDDQNHQFIIEGKNTSNWEVFTNGNTLRFYSLALLNTYTVDKTEYTGTDTKISFVESKPKKGYAGTVETGILLEDDTTTNSIPDNDRILYYAAPVDAQIDKIDRKKTKFAKGGTLNKSFEEALQFLIPEVDFSKTTLDLTPDDVNTYAYTGKVTPLIFILGITRAEWNEAKAIATNSGINQAFFKLLSNTGAKTDSDTPPHTYYEYDLQVAGLDGSNDFKTADVKIGTKIVKIYTTDKRTFVSAEFGKRFDIDTTLAMQTLDDFVYKTLYQNGKDFKLTYHNPDKRFGSSWDNPNNPKFYYSMEEYMNLSSDKFWTAYGINGYYTQPGKSNLDLFRLDIQTPPIPITFRDKVESFKDGLDNITPKKSTIREHIIKSGQDLLLYAKTQIRISGKAWENKDGMLYLARLIMSVIIRNHPTVFSKFSLNGIQNLLDDFEKYSRGLEGSQKPTFAIATPTKFNILVSGFDPFGSVSLNKYFDWDGHQSNPSGNLVLALDGEKIPDGHGREAIIKSVIFPVRFREFNKGWVESFFKPYVEDENIKMIITFSYGIESHTYNFEIERFAAKKRENIRDNDHIRDPDPSYFTGSNWVNPKKKEFLHNELLDISTLFPWTIGNKDINMIIPNEVGLDQAHEHSMGRVANPTSNLAQSTLVPDPNTISNVKAIKGPGGYYLSNEIFYRVAYLRDKFSAGKFTGHIHVGFLTYDDKINTTKPLVKPKRVDKTHMLKTIRDSIAHALHGFK